MTIEEWRDIPGYIGFFQASSMGRIRGLERQVWNGRAMRTEPARVRAPFVSRSGYPCLCLRSNSRRKTHQVHQLVMLAFHGPPPPGTEVCHGNGDPLDARLSNLRYDTRSANQVDSVYHRTHPNLKLTPEQAREIRDSPMGCKRLARAYGMGKSQICRIRNGQAWAHLSEVE